MRYVVTVIGLIALIAGGFFNNYILKKIDVNIFGNTTPGFTVADNPYSSWIKMEYNDKQVTLPYMDPLFRKALQEAFKVKVAHNGENINTVLDLPVATGDQDPSKAIVSASNYEVNMQGYRPNDSLPNKFYNTVSFKLDDPSLGLLAPQQMLFEQTGSGTPGTASKSMGNDKTNFVVLKSNPITFNGTPEHAALKENNNDVRLATITKLYEVVSSMEQNPSGSATKFQKDMAEKLRALMTNEGYSLDGKEIKKNTSVAGQHLQTMLGTYYTVAGQNGDNTWNSHTFYSSGNYGQSGGNLTDGFNVYHYGELQWIYDQLVYTNNVSEWTASEVCFIINNVSLLEWNALAHRKLTPYNAWSDYATVKIPGMWDRFVAFFSNKKKEANVIAETKNFIGGYMKNKVSTNVSPLYMVAEIDFSRDTVLTKYCNEIQSYNDSPSTHKFQAIAVEDLALNMDVVQTIYWQVMQDEGVWMMKDGTKVEYNLSDKKSDFYKWATDTKNFNLNKATFNGKKIHARFASSKNGVSLTDVLTSSYSCIGDATWGSKVRSILSHNTGKDYKKMVRSTFQEKFVTRARGGYNMSSFSAYFPIANAFNDFSKEIAKQDLSGITVEFVAVNGTSFMFCYPFMASGMQLVKILDQASKDIQSSAKTYDVGTWVYIVWWNYDQSKSQDLFARQGKDTFFGSTDINDSFLYPFASGETSEPIMLGAYKDETGEGFMLSKCLWFDDGDKWRTKKEYVNIWKDIYGDQTFESLQSNSEGSGFGRIKDYRTGYMSTLTAQQKTDQKKYAVDYDLLFKTDTEDKTSEAKGGGSE